MSRSGDYMKERITAAFINGQMKKGVCNYIEECEKAYQLQVKNETGKVCGKMGRQLVMLAGPSSSGKTTTAKLIKEYAEKEGRRATTISLDDFYLDQTEKLYFEDGTPDYETVDALDKEYISVCLSSLAEKGTADLPRFCFVSKKREKELVRTEIGEDEIIIVEGLHAINPQITDNLPGEKITKMYVSVSSRIYEKEKVLFSKRDLRFIRRMIRDYHYRNSSVENTFALWKGVRMGEDRYLFPFSHLADVKIDSFHPYEPCLFKEEAVGLLSHIEKESEYYAKAKEYIEKLSLFVNAEYFCVPENSLLNEFIK